MENEQKKSNIANIVTGIVITSAIVAGYYIFINPSQSPLGAPGLGSEAASDTALMGTRIESTVRDLSDLRSAVSDSIIIFKTPAFQNLQNFTAEVPSEPVGRANPFVPTDWKLQMSASANASTGNTESQPTTQQSRASAPAQTSTSPSATVTAQPASNMLGNFPSAGI